MPSPRISFIGSGNMARAHARAFMDIEGVQLVGVYSRTVDKAINFAEEFGVEIVSSSIEDLFVRAKPDLVVIAVSELALKGICQQAFRYPWRLLIEKPVGHNLSEANYIFEISKELGAKAYVALNRRHYASTRSVLSEVVCMADARLVQVFDQEDPYSALKGGKPEAVVANWMYANSIHLIDYFQIFCRGSLSSVEHLTKWIDRDAAYRIARLNFSSGDVGIYQAIWNAPGPWAVSITTRQRRWELRPLENASIQNYNSHKLNQLPIDSIDVEFKPGFRFQANEAIKAIRGLPHSLPSLADGLKTMQFISKIYEL